MRLRSAPARRPILAGLVALASIAGVSACGGDDSTATAPSISATLLSAPPAALLPTSSSSTTPGAEAVATTDLADAAGRPSTTTDPARSTSTSARSGPTSAPDTTAGTVGPAESTTTRPAPTGVPGGTSDTALCRDYATVVGSQSVLTIAGAFGDLDTVGLARLELIASPSIVAAAGSLADEWPTELASERALVADAVIGPIAERAAVARGAIDAAGIDEAVLVTAWETTLATYDPSDPAVTVTGLAPAVEAALATAASTYAATSVRYDMDTSLLRGAPTPQTTTYLFDRCPELSYLIAGDAD